MVKIVNNQTKTKVLYHIPIFGRFIKYYSMFHRYTGHKTLLLGIISFLTAITEGVGIAVFIAYIQFLATKNTAPSPFILKIQYLFHITGVPFHTFWVVAAFVVIFSIRGVLVCLGKGYHFSLYSYMKGKIHEDLSRAISTMRYTDYLKRNSGFFTHVITTEAHRTLLAFYQVAAMFPIAISITTYIFLSIRVDWRFTILATIFGLGIGMVFRFVNRRIIALSHELSPTEAKMHGLIIQLLQSFKYLYSTCSLAPLQSKIDDCSDQVAHAGARMGFLSAILPVSSETIIVAFLGSMIYLQTEVFIKSIDSMMVAMMFLYRAMRETTVLQGSWQTFNQYVGGVDSVINTIDELTKNVAPTGGKKFQGIRKSLQLTNVSFKYGENEVLKNINITIPANSMVAFVGESGAGKSTLVDLLTGLMQPTSGDIFVDGLNYKELNLNTLRSNIGYVTQDSVVFDDTLINNVSLWRWERELDGLERAQKALKRAHCQNFVENFQQGLHELVGERGVRLSGGQKQRLSIARELYKQPTFLILDEATSSLDSESESQVQESIDSLKGSTTIAVIAHRLATVRNCDMIFVLSKGQIVESGTFENLKAQNSIFSRMCQAQSLA